MIKVNLVGGLGNQLFQYYAGLFLAEGDIKRLKIRTAFSEFGRTGHLYTISELGLPGIFERPRSNEKIRLLLPIARRSFERKMGSCAQVYSSLSSISPWFSTERLGFESSLDPNKLGPRTSIWGYFQTWRYAQALQEMSNFPIPSIEKTSDWYQLQVSIQKSSRALVIHVRRGDYKKERGTFGLLSSEYYRSAISRLKETGASWEQAWIYTDEPDLVQTEFAELIRAEGLQIANPSSKSSPGESLLAMSESDYLVIGNSTFSWWPAFLSTRTERILRPEKWFMGMDDPLDLFPENWESVKSHWVEL